MKLNYRMHQIYTEAEFWRENMLNYSGAKVLVNQA